VAIGPGDSDHGEAMDRALRSAARMYADDQAARALGISIDEVAPGRATARMRVTEDMTNGHGIAHGGYIFLLADTAFAYACNSYGPVTVAQACQITFYDVSVRRADGEVLAELRGHSRTVRPGPASTNQTA
jgi:acyl-CoA thioesterase